MDLRRCVTPTSSLMAALLLLGPAALAQTGGHSDHAASAATANAASEAFVAANERMHADMAIEFTGNADVDFARGMIPHHQGAIDMARIVLEHGSDPALRALAATIVETQQGEIAFLHDWLARHGH